MHISVRPDRTDCQRQLICCGWCCHSEGSQQAGETAWKMSHEIQQRQHSPALGIELSQHCLWTDQLEGQLCRAGDPDAHVMNLNQHVIITPVVMKASHGLGCISKNAGNKSREVFIPIFLEFMCFLLEYCVWFGALQWMIDIHRMVSRETAKTQSYGHKTYGRAWKNWIFF